GAQILEQFKSYSHMLLNPDCEKFKQSGGKILGYMCPFVPEELVFAAGMLPLRIRGTGCINATTADTYFSSTSTCSFVRHSFESVISDQYELLDGIAFARTCDVMSVFGDNMLLSGRRNIPVHMLQLPHVTNQAAVRYYRNHLDTFKTFPETEYGAVIGEESLRASVRLCNETKLLQRQLNALLKAPQPLISGSDLTAIIVAGFSMPRELYNSLLKQLLASFATTEPTGGSRPLRLMVVGSCGDDSLIADIAETLGVLVVCDLTCFGGQHRVGDVDENSSDVLLAIAEQRLTDNPFCSVLLGAAEKRSSAVGAAIKEYAVDGVIGQWLGCCDAAAATMQILRREMKEAGVPCFIIKRDYVPDTIGQITTRIQAFCETLTGDRDGR
ncbi:MAG: 2-hydroxyacyl-CoA dehydratase family protein, partial [Lentisphaerota bacterium]